MSDASGLGESSAGLDFMSMKGYPDMSLDISMLNPLGDFTLSSHFKKTRREKFDHTLALMQVMRMHNSKLAASQNFNF